MKIGDIVIFRCDPDEIFDDVKQYDGMKAKIIEIDWNTTDDTEDIAIEFGDGETMNTVFDELEIIENEQR